MPGGEIIKGLVENYDISQTEAIDLLAKIGSITTRKQIIKTTADEDKVAKLVPRILSIVKPTR